MLVGQRGDLRSGYAALLKERVAASASSVCLAPPRPEPQGQDIAAPGGCLFCGVAAVEVPAVQVARSGGREQAARGVWTSRRVSISSLGRWGPEYVVGFTCPACSAAIETVGSVGPTSLERALMTYADPASGGRVPNGDQLAGLVGWGALVAHARQRTPSEPGPRPTTGPGSTCPTSMRSGSNLARHVDRRGLPM